MQIAGTFHEWSLKTPISTSYTGRVTVMLGILGPQREKRLRDTIYSKILLGSKCWIFKSQQLASKENTFGGKKE